MSKLRELWEEYKRLEDTGSSRTGRILDLEKEIHDRQREIGTAPFDFDKKWAKKEQDGTSTLLGPPLPDSKPVEVKEVIPQNNFTFDEARKIIGENDFAILEDCNRMAEAMMTCIENIANKRNTENQRNPARRGQSINLTINLFNRRKDE